MIQVPKWAFPTEIDNTMRSAFVSCPRKFLFRHLMHKAPPWPSVHLHAGGAFAAGLERVRKGFYLKKESPEDALAEGWVRLMQEYGDFETVKPTNKTAHGMGEALISYFDEYPLEREILLPYTPPGGEPAIEFKFGIPLPIAHPETGDPIIYCGRFDMLGVQNGHLFVVDEKTTGSLGEYWARRYELSAQFTGYCWAARELGYGAPVGAIIRGIGILKTQINHVSLPLMRPPFMVDEWYDQLLTDIQRMIDAYQKMKFDANLSDACGSYSGCDFLPVCSVPADSRPGLLQINYVEREWSPLKGDGDE